MNESLQEQLIDVSTGRGRLAYLAHFLRRLPPGVYQHSLYWCGSRGCALGHAAHDPLFNSLGFVMNINEVPSYKHEVGHAAASLFFEISLLKTLEFFSGCGVTSEQNHNPLIVAERIEEYLRGNQ